MTGPTGERQMTQRGKPVTTTRRLCKVCRCETEQYKYLGTWVCSECLFNPESECMRTDYRPPGEDAPRKDKQLSLPV
jgi:hypothetical protein